MHAGGRKFTKSVQKQIFLLPAFRMNCSFFRRLALSDSGKFGKLGEQRIYKTGLFFPVGFLKDRKEKISSNIKKAVLFELTVGKVAKEIKCCLAFYTPIHLNLVGFFLHFTLNICGII